MTSFEIWLTIFLLAIATIMTRGSFFLFGAAKLPPLVQHALRYAPAAALAAIVVPDLVLSGGVVNQSWMNPKLIAAACAALFFVTTQRMLGSILVGMGFFTLLRLAM